MIQLEKYRGGKSRHICPSCGQRNAFARYRDSNGEYIGEDVGRCNRESNCGYHQTPKQFFADNPHLSKSDGFKPKTRTRANYGFAVSNGSQPPTEAKAASIKSDYIAADILLRTLGNYENNSFVQFLFNLFPDCGDEIQNVLKTYFVGTFGDYTCFPSLDRLNRVCRAKLIRFDRAAGKRLKGEFDTSSLPAKLKLKDFQYKQIFFGEHLLPKFPNKPVAIVEAEKTAIIAGLCLPESIWLATGSKQWLKAERLQSLGDRQIILYPDADGFALWTEKAREARANGLTVKVSSLIETHGTDAQKADGYDLADYLIEQQKEINEFNLFADDYNARLKTILQNENSADEFNLILNERKAVLMCDGNLSEAEAESVITNHNYILRIVLNL